MRPAHFFACTLLALGFFAAALPKIAGSAGSAPDQSLATVSPLGTEPDIDVHPSNANRLVVSAITAPRPLTASFGPYPAWWSNNGGHSWSQSTGAGPIYYGDPGLEFDGSGNSYLCMNVVSPPYAVFVNRSTDGGSTYPSLVEVMSQSTTFTYDDGSLGRPCTGTYGTYFDLPKLGIDRSASPPRLYVTAMAVNGIDKFADGTCDGTAMVFMSSDNGGMTWGNGRVLAGSTPFNRIAVASNGTIVLANSSNGGLPCPGFDKGIVFRKSTDHGLSFTNASCVWNTGSTDVGGTQAVVDPNDPNRVWISFNEVVATPGPCQHVYVMRSLDGGSNWTAPVRVDDALPNDVFDRAGPSLSVSSTGRLDIAWFDYRDGPVKVAAPNDSPADVYYSYSLDGGTTWATSLRVSASTAPAYHGGLNDFVTVTSSGKKAYVAFALDGNSDGQAETYVNTLTFK